MTADSDAVSAQVRRRARTKLLIIAAIFAAPVLVSWLVFLTGWVPSSTSNHGELIQPPERMAPSEWTTRSGEPFGRSDLMGYWNLLVVVDGACGQACMESLDLLRRARIALGADAGRVHLLLLQPRGAPPAEVPEVPKPVVFELLAPDNRVAALLAKSAGGGASGIGIFIIDYRAFNMMTYPVPLNGSGLLEDMEQLLSASNARFERAQRQSQGS